MESYWWVIIISNILFFSALLWLNQSSHRMFNALLDLSNKRGVMIIGLDGRIKMVENLIAGDSVLDDELDNSSQTTLYDAPQTYYDGTNGLEEE
ncbi:hypothetical protein CL614_02590 [archaeon]|nr:hypothetical protein [archaeon]